MHCCDCSPSGFKSSLYSPRATVLLQMLIVFSFSLSPGCLSFPLSLAVYTINLVHSLSHTHSHSLARRERLEGGIWTYLTEGHPSLSSPASPPPKATPRSFLASSWFSQSPLMQLSPHLLCFIVAPHIITSLRCLWCSACVETQGKQAKVNVQQSICKEAHRQNAKREAGAGWLLISPRAVNVTDK